LFCGIPLNGCAPQSPSKERRKASMMRRKVRQKSVAKPLRAPQSPYDAPQSLSKERRKASMMRRKVPMMCRKVRPKSGVIPLNGYAPQSLSKERRKAPTMRRKVRRRAALFR